MIQDIIISQNINNELTEVIAECGYDKVFILADETTKRLCWSVIEQMPVFNSAYIITIDATDIHKNIESLMHVWSELSVNGGTRHSCLINLGGGMITDLGGFAAATFKRGINFINIPTTLLAMVDASVGGKTGINFNGLKNEIGVFRNPVYVIIYTDFLKTLDKTNILSGYAEMLKHGLINNNDMWAEHIKFDLINPNMKKLQQMIAESVTIKERITTKDPQECGIRKALNFGHTIGHAFEELALRKGEPLPHGYAVAFGIICELYLSAVKMRFPLEKMRQTVTFIRDNYGKFNVTCDDYDTLIELMTHDKKNTTGIINFTLIADIGDIKIDNIVTNDEIKEALDFYREG